MVLRWCPCKGNRQMEWCGVVVMGSRYRIRAVHTLKYVVANHDQRAVVSHLMCLVPGHELAPYA